jgi:hypothetical protein
VPRGGPRPGAGRKPGGRNEKTREVAEKAAAEGITPIEVMLHAMRQHHEAERFDAAARIAKDAAPYIHPRLASVELSGPGGGPVPVTLEDVALADREAEAWEREHATRNGDSGTHRVP